MSTAQLRPDLESGILSPFEPSTLFEQLQKIFADQMQALLLDHPSRIAVAVSGGADSLALAILATLWARPHSIKVVALTVDHGLRPEAAGEAAQVGAWLQRWGVPHHILTLDLGEIPTTGVQAKARAARYDRLEQWCSSHGISTLLVAHHQLDQAETVLMRLQRGSGRDGLSGMLPVHQRRFIQVIRPLLAIPPESLRALLSELQQGHVDDPSNRNRAFERVRVRQILSQPDAQPLLTRLVRVADQAQARRDRLDTRALSWLVQHVTIHACGYATGDRESLTTGHALGFQNVCARALGLLVLAISGRDYAPPAQQIRQLVDRICAVVAEGRPVWRATLGGCLVTVNALGWSLCREARHLPQDVPFDPQGTLWDRRFWIAGQGSSRLQKMWIQPLGHLRSVPPSLSIALEGIPQFLTTTWPSLWSECGRCLGVPMVSWWEDLPPLSQDATNETHLGLSQAVDWAFITPTLRRLRSFGDRTPESMSSQQKSGAAESKLACARKSS